MSKFIWILGKLSFDKEFLIWEKYIFSFILLSKNLKFLLFFY